MSLFVSSPNSLLESGVDDALARWNTQDGNNGNVTASSAISLSHGTQYLVARMTSIGNVTSGTFYYAAASGATTSVYVGKVVSGTKTQFVALSANLPPDKQWYTITLTTNGSTITAYLQRQTDNFWLNSSGTFVSGSQVAYYTTTDSSITGQGYSGLISYANTSDGNCFYDDFHIDIAGAGNNPAASFTITGNSSNALNVAYTFTDTSTNSPTSWAWVFGDGNTSTSQNPTHAYTVAGIYTVELTATNGSGSGSAFNVIIVGIPVASFTITGNSSNLLNVAYTFTDTSTNSPTSWLWNFGDGNTSTSQNPTHAYTSPGFYTIHLTATNAAGSNIVRQTQLVGVPVASFTITGNSMNALNVAYTFTDTSTNSPTSWLWNFGDGNTSTSQNPTHAYSIAGNYGVSLTASNAAGGNTVSHTVSAGLPVASFTITGNSMNALNVAYTFTDTSSNSPTSWTWNFGDGNTSTMRSPTHAYAAVGVYTVHFTAANTTGSSSTSHTVAVGTPVASFVISGNSNNTTGVPYTFTDTSSNSPSSWLWAFGDGHTSTSQNPTHSYSTCNTFTVSLTATNAAGSNTTNLTVVVSGFSDNFSTVGLLSALPYSINWNAGGTGLGNFSVNNSHQAVATGIGSNLATVKGISQVNVSVKATVGGLTKVGARVGLVARYRGPGDSNMYIGRIANIDGIYFAQILSNVNGTWNLIASKQLTVLQFRGTGTLEFDVHGTSLVVKVNSVVVISVTNTFISSSGSVGIRASTGGWFANFSVSP